MLAIMGLSFCDACLTMPSSLKAPPDSIDPGRSCDAAWLSRMTCTVRHQCAGRGRRRQNLLHFSESWNPSYSALQHQHTHCRQRSSLKAHPLRGPAAKGNHHMYGHSHFDQLERGPLVDAAFDQHRPCDVFCMALAVGLTDTARFQSMDRGSAVLCADHDAECASVAMICTRWSER